MTAAVEWIESRLDRDGPGSLLVSEALDMLLREDAGERLLKSAGSLRVLASWGEAEITHAADVDPAAARAVIAAFELGRRTQSESRARGDSLSSSLDAFRHFSACMRDERREVFYAALLDVKNRLLRDVRISEGCLSASLVHPREAFAAAVREPAHAILFAHNHPSGDPSPSPEDDSLTKRLVAAGEVLGIRVLDHVVIGDGDYFSYADSGRLRPERRDD